MLLDELRQEDKAYLLQHIDRGDCCAVVGASNTGKSGLLRGMAREERRHPAQQARAPSPIFVYLDFNLMLETTEQGFYELILRCITDELAQREPVPEFLQQLRRAYQTLVAPPSPFQISLSFSEGMTAVCQGLTGQLVLLCDEFDEPFEQIEGRAFLNLRALKNKYDQRLCFVTATNHRLPDIRHGRDVDEFLELFEPFTRFLGPLDTADADRVLACVASEQGFTFDEQDRAFVRDHAQGHLGLLLAIARALGQVTGQPVRDAGQDWLIHRQVREQLDNDVNVQTECRELWDEMTVEQRNGLMAVMAGEEVDPPVLEELRSRGLLLPDDLVFSPVFEKFVRRQRFTQGQPRQEGVQVDVESGNVWVNGRQVPTLTELEYRLLLKLYGRLDKICDKYEIVETVWGEQYIDRVDDARIDKLLSRLRTKIEPDPGNPRYLLTVRGRGYKLTTP